jgi:hypothetical protein
VIPFDNHKLGCINSKGGEFFKFAINQEFEILSGHDWFSSVPIIRQAGGPVKGVYRRFGAFFSGSATTYVTLRKNRTGVVLCGFWGLLCRGQFFNLFIHERIGLQLNQMQEFLHCF